MAKTCQYQGCHYPVWGKGYCKFHQYLRTDLKRKPVKRTFLKRTPIRKINRKSGERSKLHQQDLEFFSLIWEERLHVCFESGISLGNEPNLLFFHHCLQKGERRFKKYRYAKWNIVLLHPDFHTKENYLRLLPHVLAYRNYLLENLEQIENGEIKVDASRFQNQGC